MSKGSGNDWAAGALRGLQNRRDLHNKSGEFDSHAFPLKSDIVYKSYDTSIYENIEFNRLVLFLIFDTIKCQNSQV